MGKTVESVELGENGRVSHWAKMGECHIGRTWRVRLALSSPPPSLRSVFPPSAKASFTPPRLRPWTVIILAPAPASRVASSTVIRTDGCSRIFAVT